MENAVFIALEAADFRDLCGEAHHGGNEPLVEALRPRGIDGAVAAVDFSVGACHSSVFPVGHACRGESRRIVNGEGPRAVGVGGFGRGDEEGEASGLFPVTARGEGIERGDFLAGVEVAGEEFADDLVVFAAASFFAEDGELDADGVGRVAEYVELGLFVHHEREVGDAAEFAGGDGGGGDDFEAPDGIVVAEVVNDGVPRRESAAGRDLGEVNVAVGLLADTADVRFRHGDFPGGGLEEDGVGGVFEDETAEGSAVVHFQLVRNRFGVLGDERAGQEGKTDQRPQDVACC